jgi:hypothetical protein
MAEIRTKALFILTLKSIDILPGGSTPGVHRLIGIVGGGAFEGDRVRGTVLPGGNDWIIARADGTWAIDVRLPLKTDDGAMIGMSYKGVRLAAPDALERVKRGETVDLGRPVPGGVVYDMLELM